MLIVSLIDKTVENSSMLIPHFKAIAKANALNKDNYKDFTAVEAAVNAVVRDKNITEQSEVDAMVKAIEDAIAVLQYKDADYTKVDADIAKANALNKDNYKDFSAVETAVNAVVRDKNITEQTEVDAMAKAIEDAIAALQYKDADYTKVDAAIAKAKLEAAGFKKSTYKKSKKKAGVRSVKDGFLWYWTLPEVEKPIENGQEVTDEDDLPI